MHGLFFFCASAVFSNYIMKGDAIMIREIINTANQYGYTGMKRVIFYIIAPVIGAIAYVVGFVRGIIDAFTKNV